VVLGALVVGERLRDLRHVHRDALSVRELRERRHDVAGGRRGGVRHQPRDVEIRLRVVSLVLDVVYERDVERHDFGLDHGVHSVADADALVPGLPADVEIKRILADFGLRHVHFLGRVEHHVVVADPVDFVRARPALVHVIVTRQRSAGEHFALQRLVHVERARGSFFRHAPFHGFNKIRI
jgi:hypothetical protein